MIVRTIKCYDTIFLSLSHGLDLSNTHTAGPTNWEIEKVHPLQKPFQVLNTGNSHQLQYFKTSLAACYDINCPPN